MKRIAKKLIGLVLGFALIMGLAVPVSANHGQRATSISSFMQQIFVVMEDGTLWGWGRNSDLFAFHSDGYYNHAVLREPILLREGVKSVISAGLNGVVVIKQDNSLWEIQMRTRTVQDGLQGEWRKLFDDVRTAGSGWAILNDNSLWVWDSRPWRPFAPTKIIDNVLTASGGFDGYNKFVGLVVKHDGSLWGIGANLYGQLGDGTRDYRDDFVKIMDGVMDVVSFRGSTMIIKDDGSLWAVGSNYMGRLGDGRRTHYGVSGTIIGEDNGRLTPVKILDNVKKIHLTTDNVFAIREDNSLWAWGNNSRGAIGLPAQTSPFLTPQKIMDNVAEVASTGVTTHILTLDGSLWFCGATDFGVGYTSARDAPVQNPPAIIMDNVRMPSLTKPTQTSASPPVTAPPTPPATDEIRVIVNGTALTFDQPPIIQDGRTLVPLRAIFEALGAEVQWEQQTQTVTATRGDIVVTMRIGSNILNRNGAQTTLDVPAQIVSGRTLVPARAVAESFGADVGWDAATRTVTITE